MTHTSLSSAENISELKQIFPLKKDRGLPLKKYSFALSRSIEEQTAVFEVVDSPAIV
jgi:hypothetical protein